MNKSSALLGTFDLLRDLWRFLTSRQKRNIYFLVIIMLFSSVAEILTLASIFPLFSLFLNPEIAWLKLQNVFLVVYLGVDSINDLRVLIFTSFCILVLLSGCIRLLNLWLNGRISASIASSLGSRYFSVKLNQPYLCIVDDNSGDFIAEMTLLVTSTSSILYSSLQFFTAFLISISLTFTLLIIDFRMTLLLVGLFIFIYSLFAYFSRIKLNSNSRKIANLTKLQVRCLQETIGSVRDILMDSRQGVILGQYKLLDLPLRITAAESTFLGAFPKFAIEASALLILASLAFYFTVFVENGENLIPILATMAIASQRLLPLFQSLYANWAGIKGNSSSARDILEKLSKESDCSRNILPSKPLRMHQSFKLVNVSFSYVNSSEYVLRDVNLDIRKGQKIGIIGSTGSGKSTLMDIILGLICPQKGSLVIDDVDISSSSSCQSLLANWRLSISHVPQSIYLTDSTIQENIALGVDLNDIDQHLMADVLKVAQIDSYIDSLPDGINTEVGERGLKLSGGQRQRIGIARALYKKSDFIVLDEATSALDQSTETLVMDAINNLPNSPTLLIVAHRLSTLSCCDKILKIADGSVVETTYDAIST